MQKMACQKKVDAFIERTVSGLVKRDRKTNKFLTPGIAALIFCFILFSGCTASKIKEDRQAADAALSLIWPNPPEPARIAYLKTIEKPQDIGAGTGFFAKLAEFILGARVDDIVKPYGVAVDSGGRIVVADTALRRVHIFDGREKKYNFIEDAGKETFSSPIAVAVDASDNIYVTDSVLGKVFAYNKKGAVLFDFKAGERPTGIAVDKEDKKLYVSDTISHSINVYDLKGNLIRTIGKFGVKPGEFNYPVDLFVDKNGELYVIDAMNYRVQIFDKTGKFISMFGHQGDGTGDLGRPKGIAVDRDGNIYIADALFDTVQIFDREGRFLLNFGALGIEAGTFWMPCGVFIDDSDNIYVADSYNRRLQVFEYLGNG